MESANTFEEPIEQMQKDARPQDGQRLRDKRELHVMGPSKTSETANAREDQSAKKAIVAFLVVVALLGTGLELFVRLGITHLSKLEARIEAARTEAAKVLKAPNVEQKRRVLVIGNSIANDGLDLSRMNQSAEDRVYVSSIVEDTTWLDWRYLLSRSFAEGWRPDTVMVVCRPSHFLGKETRGRYAAHRLHQFSDIPQIALRSGRDATGMSELVLANWSAFYSFRNELTKITLTRLFPGFANLAPLLRSPSSASPPDDAMEEEIAEHLDELERVVSEGGAQLIVVVPPALTDAGIALAPLEAAAKRVGVMMLHPIQDRRWPEDYFTDGYHLNAIGQEAFTREVASVLAQTNAL